MIARRPCSVFSDVRAALAAAILVSVAAVACDRAALLAPTRSTITLTAASRIVPLNGSTEVSATVLENSGQPVPNGTTVRFTTNIGRVEPVEAQTRNGVATTIFFAGTESGIAQVRAVSGLATGTAGSGENAPASNVVEISVGAAAATRVSLTANPGTVRPSGSTSEITALVTDDRGNGLASVPVSFTTTRGTINPTIATTDATGNARTTLAASETATVTARVGSGAENRTATLEIRAATVASFTLTTSPASPAVGQPVVLTITPAANTAPRIVLNWGDVSGDQDIGVVAAPRSVTHTYTAPGFYTINAQGTSPDGEEFSNSVAVTVAQRPPVALTVNPTTGTTATVFAFTITPTTGALIQNVTINYGDGIIENLGAISTQTTRQHQYNVVNTYTAVVTQTETSGQITQASVTVSVTP